MHFNYYSRLLYIRKPKGMQCEDWGFEEVHYLCDELN